MASNHWTDGMPAQSVQLLQRLNIPTALASGLGEPSAVVKNSSGSSVEVPELAAATPNSSNALLVAGPIMNTQYSNQSVDVFLPGSSPADGSMSSRDDAFGSEPRANTFNNGYHADSHTEDRSGGVSPSKPRSESFVAKLGRIQAEEQAARGLQGSVSFQPRHFSGPADSPAHDLVSDRAQIDSPITPRNPLQETHINPPHGVSRVARSASYLSLVNPYRLPSVQGNTPTRSTYLDQISPLRFPNTEQASPLNHRNRTSFDPNHFLQINSQFSEHTEAAMPPRHAPSVGQLSAGRVTTSGQGVEPVNVSSLRRMASTPALMSPQAPMSASGNGHVDVPTRPAAMSQALTGQAIGGGNVPVHAKTAEFLRCIKKMILHAVQINRYKNGLFVTSITPRSELLNDLTVFIDSAQVTGLDNLRMFNIKEGVERVYTAIRQGTEVKTIHGQVSWAVDMEANWMVSELADILNSTDKHENARWLSIYGNP